MTPISRSAARLFWAAFAVSLCLAAPAGATHFRYSHITWKPTGAPGEVVFRVSSSFRRGAPGTFAFGYTGTATDGGLAVGDTFDEYIGATRLFFGDGGSTPVLIYKVDAINTVEDWVVAHAINPATGGEWRHTFAGSGPYTARIDSCCRTGVEINNPGRSYEVSTVVDLSLANSSPVSAVPPIVPCPVGPCIFPLPGADSDGDILSFRLSTSAEAGDAGFQQPGAGSPTALTIGSTGILTWDSTEDTIGLYSTSVTLNETRGATQIGKVMLDFLINTDEFLGVAPQFDVPPTPENAETIEVIGGTQVALTIQCSDADPGELVTLGHLGLPPGAEMTPTNAIGNPAVAVFTWTPVLTQAATVGLTCVDTLGNRTLPQSFSVVVDGLVVPPGADRDNDLFCDSMSINQLISSGIYNVIDNDLMPSTVLVGTAGRDLILAGGLGDKMYGLGGDDCLIGGVGPDYASGGDGADQIFGWNGLDVLEGDDGDDVLIGYDQNDVLLGGPGNDFMEGQDNEDVLRGGPGNDIMTGGDDIDLMHGDDGNDQITAGFGDDVLDGGPGDDVLDGESGGDVCVVDGSDSTPALGCAVFPPVSTSPTLVTPIGDQSLAELAVLSIPIVADDPDDPVHPDGPPPGSLLSFRAEHLPAFATLTDHGDRTATLDIAPQSGDAGSYPGVIIRVEDDGEPMQGDIEVVDISVTGGNLPPVMSLIASHVLSVNETLSIGITSTDPDAGDTLTYAAIGLPPFVTLTDHGGGSATLDIQPGSPDAGQYHGVEIRVVDDGIPIREDSEIFSIIVNLAANEPPFYLISAGSPTVQEGDVWQRTLRADDPDAGDTLSFSSSNLPAFATLTDHGDRTATLRVAPQAGDVGTYAGVAITVTDNGTPPLNTSDIITISVALPECSDGLDNDSDGKIDWDPAAGLGDPDCGSPTDRKEATARKRCGLGTELAVLLPPFAALYRRRRRARGAAAGGERSC